MATKKQDILALLDKAVGKKGPLRIPAYWMREVLLKIMDWAEGLTPEVDVPTKISQLENDAGLATQSYVNAEIYLATYKKQDKITDLSTIRSNASKGATAIQAVKTINGASIVGSGDLSLATKEELVQLNDEIISNEKVISGALTELDEKIEDILQRIKIMENN